MRPRRRKEPGSLGVLLRIPVFRRLWAAITISSLGDWLGLLATTSLAAYLTKESSGLAQGAAVSGVLLVRLAPDLLLGPIAGALVDRIDRRKIAVIGDSIAGSLYLSIAVTSNITWLLVAQFLVEAVGLFSNPAKQAMWVNIVPRERLAVANQLNYVSIYGMVPVAAAVFAVLSTVAQFFGAKQVDSAGASSAIGGGPTSSTAITIALLIDAATYFFCAGMVFFSRKMIPAFIGERSTSKSVFSLIIEGVSFIRHSRVMRAIYIGILGAFGAGGLTAGVAQSFVTALGAGSAGYGILFGAVFTGLAIGMLIGPKILPTIPRRMIFTSAIGAAGLVLLVMSVLQDFVGAAIAASLMGLFAGIAWITGFTMIGHEVSDQLRGRVFAFVMSSVRLSLLATIAVGPIIAGAVGSHRLLIGNFKWDLSGAGIVLACGGAIAIGVSLFAARQVGGLSGGLLRRLIGSRRADMLDGPAEYPGVLIAVEGADPAQVDAYAQAIEDELTAGEWSVRRLSGCERDTEAEADLHATALRAVADLSERVTAMMRPALAGGTVVLSTDYIDAAVVKFGVEGGLGDQALLRMALWAVDGLWPDLTVLVDRSDGSMDEITADIEGSAPGGDPASVTETGDSTSGRAAGPVDKSGDPILAYRERAATAPERYLIVHPLGVDHVLPAEISERIAAELRQRAPKKLSSLAGANGAVANGAEADGVGANGDEAVAAGMATALLPYEASRQSAAALAKPGEAAPQEVR